MKYNLILPASVKPCPHCHYYTVKQNGKNCYCTRCNTRFTDGYEDNLDANDDALDSLYNSKLYKAIDRAMNKE